MSKEACEPGAGSVPEDTSYPPDLRASLSHGGASGVASALKESSAHHPTAVDIENSAVGPGPAWGLLKLMLLTRNHYR